jgi:phage shock protein C
MTDNAYPEETPRKLRRSSGDRMIAGVCGGWARLLGVDASIVRILFVAATLLGAGTPALLYLACLFLMPADDDA